MDVNKDVESPMRKTSDWGFVGYLKNGKSVPIGVYSSYCLGRKSADAWMARTAEAESWEGVPMYEELEDE